MKNIILLGHKGFIGKRLFQDFNTFHNVFTVEHKDIKRLINKRFILEKKIDYIINCIGIKDKKELFFISNYVLPGYISKKLSEIDPFVNKKILYIHISSIGVNNPFETFNLNEIKVDICSKQKINYNPYEFSKAAGDYIVINNMSKLKNIKYKIIKPSNIIDDKSTFILKLKIFLLLFPFRMPKYATIPITEISDISKYISLIINKKITSSKRSKHLYSNYYLSDFTKLFRFFISAKPALPVRFMKYFIKKIPNIKFFISFKRLLTLIYFL
mgnify:CR=1 FL=1